MMQVEPLSKENTLCVQSHNWHDHANCFGFHRVQQGATELYPTER